MKLTVISIFFFQEGKLTEEQFATNLQTTLNSPPQPNLVGFLKVGVNISAIWQKRWEWHKTFLGSLSKTEMLLFKVFWRLRTCSIMYPSLIWNPYKFYSLKTVILKWILTLWLPEFCTNLLSLDRSTWHCMTIEIKPLREHPTGAILSLIFQKIDLRFFL